MGPAGRRIDILIGPVIVGHMYPQRYPFCSEKAGICSEWKRPANEIFLRF